ncbi:phosphohydrolase [Dickeya phage vB_DsoM_JA29]|uniref:Uncharacterized protein n=1 Tax=Dickeya phage vB_DsoM_JA29 TaxID=2283031 RepID=A0A384ZXP8_9CAUD|nr:phosphohydrolase [Dickeya phage vB_DsoM_JA29]AXG67012.1 hypothetical protein JA29_286 [Dickeya phage vB_DsoM_JA29]
MELLTGIEFEARLKSLTSQYNLVEYHEWIQKNNSVRGTAFYHSNLHMDGVAMLCMDLLPEEAHDDRDAVFCLLAAALIHDMDHTLGEYSDNVNIQNAIAALRDWTWASPADSDFKRLLPEIEKLIYITEFPYMPDREPQTVYEKVLRDSDILWGILPGRAVTIVEGLRTELLHSFPQYTSDGFRLVNFIYDRIDFLRSLTWATEKGKKLFDRFIIQHKLEMLDYINSVKSYEDRK